MHVQHQADTSISADRHQTVYVECDITPIRNKQVPSEIKLYSNTDLEGLTDHMSSVKDSFIVSHSVAIPIHSMWNNLMTDLASALDTFVPKKIARTKDSVPGITNKLKK